MASSLWKQCFYACETGRKGVQKFRKTGSHKNWLEPAKIKVTLSIVWSLISISLPCHHDWYCDSSKADHRKPKSDTREGGLAAHHSKANKEAWKIPWVEEPGRLQSMGSLRVRRNWATSFSLFTFLHWRRKEHPLQRSSLENPRDGGWVSCRLWGRTESDTTEVTYQ